MTDYVKGQPYPSDEELKNIQEFEGDHMDLVDYLEEVWIHDYGYMKRYNYGGKHKIYLATGGWSGNEEIIGALKESKSLFWLLHWKKSQRGGAFWFELPSKKRGLVQTKEGLVSVFGK